MNDGVLVFEKREFEGGTITCEYAEGGHIRLVVDHPSNDPETEVRLGMKAVALLRKHFEKAGLPVPEMTHFIWRSDP